MSIEKRPHKVEKARTALDSEALSIMGSHGAARAAENKKNRSAQEAHEKELELKRAADEEWQRMKATNEHIIPPPSPYGD